MPEAPSLRKHSRAKPQPLLTLKVAQQDGGVEPRTLVNWCVSKQLVAKLQEEGFIKPHLLIVVRSKQSESIGDAAYETYSDTDHVVVPLVNEQTFVRFRRPGANELIPMIVDVRNEKDAKRLGHLRRNRDTDGDPLYGSVINDDGELKFAMTHDFETSSYRSVLKYIKTNFSYEVNVPQEMFADEPSARIKAFTGRFFSDPKGDEQCDTRKRIIVSMVAVVPFLVLGNLFKVLSTLVAAVLTKREYNWWHLKHPFIGRVDGVVFDNEDNTLFLWQHKNGRRRAWPFFVWNHLTVVVLPALVFWAMQAHKHGSHGQKYQLSPWGWWKTVAWIDGVFVGVLVAGLILLGLFGFGGALRSTPKAKARARQREENKRLAQQSAQARRAQEVLRELSAMVCTPESLNSPPTLNKNKLTVSLVYNAVKTKVCKPYAK